MAEELERSSIVAANDSEISWLTNQREHFFNKPSVREFYGKLFEMIRNEIPISSLNGTIIEIGAGAGFSSHFLKDLSYIKTDAIDTGFQDKVVNAESMPYQDNSVDIIFGLDVFHHISMPFLFLNEAQRVLKPGGRLILIEPAITLVSWPIYKFLHPEPMKWRIKVSEKTQFSDSRVMDANNALPSLIFKNNHDGDLLKYGLNMHYRTKLFGLLSMLATGGLNSSFSIPILNKDISKLFQFELRIPKRLANHIFLRTLIVSEKIITKL